MRLLCDRAALARPGFSLTAGNAADIGEICRRLDGIPLAIGSSSASTSWRSGIQVRLLRQRERPPSDRAHPSEKHGWDDRVINLTLACDPCNDRKADRPIEEFLRIGPSF